LLSVDPPERCVDDLLRVVRNISRLAALQRTGLLDTPPDAAFDRLTRLATKMVNAPAALVSLVDSDRQFFKSAVGLPEPWNSRRETPLTHSFCKHVVATARELIVANARAHPVLCGNMAIEAFGVVAYAGVPLVTAQGDALGSLCVIDTKPREWTPHHLEILRELAAIAMREIEMRQLVKEAEGARTAAEMRLRHLEEQLRSSER
jgi:GAF domain-containing protein